METRRAHNRRLWYPKPENPNLYYIFTVDTSVGDNDPDYGLNYSI